MKYPLAGDLQAQTVSRVIANPRGNASGRYELHAEGGLEAIYADRDQAEFEADMLRRRGVPGVEVKTRAPANERARQGRKNPTGPMTRDQAWLAFRAIIREPGVHSMLVARDLALEYRWTLKDLSQQGEHHGIFVLSPAEVGAKLCQVEWEVDQLDAEAGVAARVEHPSGWGVGFKFVWMDNDEILFVPSSTRYYKTADAADRAAAADAWAMAKQMKQLMEDSEAGAPNQSRYYSIPEVRSYLMAVLDKTFKDTEPPELYEMRATASTGEAPKKKRTFLEARDDIWAALNRAGWSMSSAGLKTPHATSPNGYLRLWFKPQTVHATINSSELAPGVRHVAGDARAIAYDLDIRTLSPSEFLDLIQERFPKAFA